MKKNSRLRQYALSFSLFLGSTAVAYLVGEIVVRVWFPQPMLPRYVVDAPYGIRVNKPNMSVWHTSPEYHVNVRTNSHGIRADREISYHKPPGFFRIVGLGDSFTLGYEVDLEDTYLYQLEKNLNEKRGTAVEVVNLSVSGFGTAEELITLKEEGFKYSPDMVILGYFNNDIENNVTSNLYAFQDDTLRRAASTYLPAVGIRKLLYTIPGYKFLAEESQLWNIFRNRISYIVQQGLYRKQREKEISVPSGNIPTSTTTDSTTTDYETRLTARLLDEVYLECSKHNIPFVLINIPYAPLSSSAIETNIPIERMKYFDKVIYVDAQPILAPFHRKREIHWEKWHGHWRPWVQHLFAKVLADSVILHLHGSNLQQ
jgi:hypothetical protein